MMAIANLRFLLLLGVALLHGVTAQLPDPAKTYVIKSSGDGATLRNGGDGQFCGSLGRNSFIYRLQEPYADAYKWRISFDNETGYGTIKSIIEGDAYQLNMLSVYAGPDPDCSRPDRQLEFSIGNGPYALRWVGSNLCLSSFGSEIGSASWVDCDFSGGIFRHWNFIETTP